MKDCIGIINLDERDSDLSIVTSNNIVSAMPIAGRYKIIDFVLSNLTNSGVGCIGIFTKKKSYSLLKHLSNGRPWDLHRKKDGLRVFNYSNYNPSYDDIHSFIENLEFIKLSRKEYIIIAPSYMICNIDYNEILNKHKKSSNDITAIYKKVNLNDKFFFNEKLIISDNNIVKEIKNISSISDREHEVNVNMEMYIMKSSLFINIVRECVMSGLYRKVNGYIKDNLNKLNVGAFEFKGYLSCINSINSYFNANKDLLNMDISRELFYSNRPIFTKQKDEAPVFYSKRSKITNSIIANGSYVEGNLENCILGRKVIIEEGALVKDSILMDNAKVGKGCIISNAIITSKSILKDGEFIGEENDKITII